MKVIDQDHGKVFSAGSNPAPASHGGVPQLVEGHRLKINLLLQDDVPMLAKSSAVLSLGRWRFESSPRLQSWRGRLMAKHFHVQDDKPL